MTRKKEGWLCPHCPQRSNRHWNIQTHIKRKHDAIGQPMKAGSSTFNNNTNSSQFVSETMDYAKKDNYHSTSPYQPNLGHYPNKPSFLSRAHPKEEESQNTDPIDNMLPWIRKRNELLRAYVEFYDLSRRLSLNPSQLSPTMANIPMSPLLLSLSSNPNFQSNKNTMINNELPAGYKVQLCNKCLPGNRLEPILASQIEMEVLTKVNHICEAASPASSIQQEHIKNSSTNIINKAQENLVSYLLRVVNMRIGLQEGGGARVDVYLKAQELNSPKLLLQHMGNKKLPENRSWIEEEEYIDLDNISHSNNVEKEKNWAYRVIKEEGVMKIIKIDNDELKDFVNNAKATFGAFQVRLDDGHKHYFLISINF
jgi:hypothetical protein